MSSVTWRRFMLLKQVLRMQWVIAPVSSAWADLDILEIWWSFRLEGGDGIRMAEPDEKQLCRQKRKRLDMYIWERWIRGWITWTGEFHAVQAHGSGDRSFMSFDTYKKYLEWYFIALEGAVSAWILAGWGEGVMRKIVQCWTTFFMMLSR